jgi:hypothetical protein
MLTEHCFVSSTPCLDFFFRKNKKGWVGFCSVFPLYTACVLWDAFRFLIKFDVLIKKKLFFFFFFFPMNGIFFTKQ